MHEFFRNHLFETQKGSRTIFFRHCETKDFRRKVIPPISSPYYFFPQLNFSETLKGYATNFFGTVRQKQFGWNKLIPPDRLSINSSFHTRKFMKHRRDALWSFSVMWNKKVSTNLCCPPPPRSYAWKCSIPEFSRKTDFFKPCEAKNIQCRIVISPYA